MWVVSVNKSVRAVADLRKPGRNAHRARSRTGRQGVPSAAGAARAALSGRNVELSNASTPRPRPRGPCSGTMRSCTVCGGRLTSCDSAQEHFPTTHESYGVVCRVRVLRAASAFTSSLGEGAKAVPQAQGRDGSPRRRPCDAAGRSRTSEPRFKPVTLNTGRAAFRRKFQGATEAARRSHAPPAASLARPARGGAGIPPIFASQAGSAPGVFLRAVRPRIKIRAA